MFCDIHLSQIKIFSGKVTHFEISLQGSVTECRIRNTYSYGAHLWNSPRKLYVWNNRNFFSLCLIIAVAWRSCVTLSEKKASSFSSEIKPWSQKSPSYPWKLWSKWMVWSLKRWNVRRGNKAKYLIPCVSYTNCLDQLNYVSLVTPMMYSFTLNSSGPRNHWAAEEVGLIQSSDGCAIKGISFCNWPLSCQSRLLAVSLSLNIRCLLGRVQTSKRIATNFSISSNQQGRNGICCCI